MDGAVRAARERGAQDFLGFGRAGAEGADLGDAAGGAAAELLLADERGFLDGEVVKGVYAVLDAGGFDARLGLVDADFDLFGGVAVSELVAFCDVANWPAAPSPLFL